MRVIDFFDRGADLCPDRPFLVGETGSTTHRQARAMTHRIANALRASGVKTDSKVAVYSPNSALSFECVLGILRAGAVWVPVNVRNATAENCYIVDQFDVEIVLYDSRLESAIAEIRRACPKVRQFICLGIQGKSAPSFDQWIAAHDDVSPEVEDRPDRVFAIFSTGGTTGRPKGAVWSTRVFETMVANFFSCLPSHEPPVHLVTAPLTHAAGGFALMLSAAGATHVIAAQADPLWIMEAIERHGVTHIYLPPTLIYMMLAHPKVRDFDYSSLRHFIYGAAPMSVEKLKQAIEVFGPVMTQLYGQSEAPGVCTCLLPSDHHIGSAAAEKRLSSCGRPTLFTPVEIMDDHGRILPRGERGEIVVRGNLVMDGYYKNHEATAEVSAFGWHHTGDVGYKDEAGYVYIVDRKKDLIISGGFNIYPSEIEQVIWGHPAVQECVVIGVPDEKWGEAVKAVIELKPDAIASEDEIVALCKERLGSVKAPKTVEFWKQLPRTAVGKVKKKDIRQKYWEGQGRLI